jgi:hypothetical protein
VTKRRRFRVETMLDGRIVFTSIPVQTEDRNGPFMPFPDGPVFMVETRKTGQVQPIDGEWV